MAKKQTTFSEAFAELEDVTKWFETEDVDLDEGIKKFERGIELANICKKKLSSVENKIEELKESFDELTES